jgi:kynurenine 3-monooxygenase
MNLRKKSTHTWPRNNSLLLAFPNPDESSTLMFNLPKNGEESFETLSSDKAIEAFIAKYFPELTFVLPEIIESLLTRPLGNFVTVKASPWFYKDSVVLVGDAAHAVLPFYGQGMCAAFEDCLSLTTHLSKRKNRQQAFASYQTERKRNTDLLAGLSILNFLELRDRSRSEQFVLKNRAYTLLNRIAPKRFYPPLYVMIAHGSLPYAEAFRIFKKQERIMRYLGLDLILGMLVMLLKSYRFIKMFATTVSFSKTPASYSAS